MIKAVVFICIGKIFSLLIDQQIAFGGLIGSNNCGIIDLTSNTFLLPALVSYIQLSEAICIYISEVSPGTERIIRLQLLFGGRISKGKVSVVQK